MKSHWWLVLQGHYQAWDKKGPLFTSLFLINQEKYMVSAWARGGRQDFNFTIFYHFGRPVSSILNFIAQKVRGGRQCRIENLLWLALLHFEFYCIMTAWVSVHRMALNINDLFYSHSSQNLRQPVWVRTDSITCIHNKLIWPNIKPAKLRISLLQPFSKKNMFSWLKQKQLGLERERKLEAKELRDSLMHDRISRVAVKWAALKDEVLSGMQAKAPLNIYVTFVKGVTHWFISLGSPRDLMKIILLLLSFRGYQVILTKFLPLANVVQAASERGVD